MNKRKPKKILPQSSGLPIYQLYIWIHDIHPIIWRRILVCADSTIEDLHYTLQIATAFVESTVNYVISKRFVKKQQMRWTQRGAHLLLQTRVQVLNDDLRKTFCRWFQGMMVESEQEKMAA